MFHAKYKIIESTRKNTLIYEYYEGRPIYSIRVFAPYHGGNIEKFINSNKHLKNYLFTDFF